MRWPAPEAGCSSQSAGIGGYGSFGKAFREALGRTCASKQWRRVILGDKTWEARELRRPRRCQVRLDIWETQKRRHGGDSGSSC